LQHCNLQDSVRSKVPGNDPKGVGVSQPSRPAPASSATMAKIPINDPKHWRERKRAFMRNY